MRSVSNGGHYCCVTGNHEQIQIDDCETRSRSNNWHVLHIFLNVCIQLLTQSMLQDKLDAASKAEVFRLLYGGVVPELEDVCEAVEAKSSSKSFQTLAYSIMGRQEQTRAARVTRIGVVQNKWPTDTSAPISDQLKDIQTRIGEIIDAAGQAGVKVCSAHSLRGDPSCTSPMYSVTRAKNTPVPQ